MANPCAAITKSGSRCRVPALTGRDHCLMHDPAAADVRREASRKGGRNRSAKARAMKLLPEAMAPEELAGWLSLLFKQVMAGRTEPRIGTASATIARAMIDVREATEVDRRLTELEQRAGLASDRRLG